MVKVIFSDEPSFRLCGASSNQKVWRENGTRFDKNNIIKTEKFGGGFIMVWGYITADGPGDLVFIDGNMNQNKYKAILEEHLLTFLRINGEKEFIFQQDGAPCHTSKMMKEFFVEHEIKLLKWTAQSPDFNPIEHIWAFMKRKLGNQKFGSFYELKQEIMRIWKEEITADPC